MIFDPLYDGKLSPVPVYSSGFNFSSRASLHRKENCMMKGGEFSHGPKGKKEASCESGAVPEEAYIYGYAIEKRRGIFSYIRSVR